MSTPSQVIKETHRLHRFIKDLKAKLEQLPKQLRNRQYDVEFHEKKLQEAQDELKKLRGEAKENDLSLKTAQDQIRKYETQLTGIISKKEFDALKNEIAHTKAKIEQLEDTGLETLTTIDEKLEQIPQLEKTLTDARAELARFEQDSEERQKSMQAELERAEKELVEVEGQLPQGDFQQMYTRLVRSKGDDGLSPVRNQICMACYTAVTAQTYNEMVHGRICVCKSCGRLIYLED